MTLGIVSLPPPVTARPAAQEGAAGDALSVGTIVRVSITSRMGANRYEAMLNGTVHVVESKLDLEPGAVLDALVIATGDRLTLRYPVQTASPAEERSANPPDATATLIEQRSAHWKVPVSVPERREIAAGARRASDAQAWVDSALYLIRMDAPPEQALVQAVYDAQRKSDSSDGVEQAPGLPQPMTPVQLRDPAQVDTAFAAAFAGGSASGGSFDFDDGSARDDQRRRQEQVGLLLNKPDGSHVAYRYGQLPLLVNGRLMEVDMALFRDRRESSGTYPLHRLVMSVQTQTLGVVKVSVETVMERLGITVSVGTPEAAARLSGDDASIRASMTELGWGVEWLRYALDEGPARAARDIVSHVLKGGSVDGRI
jgi:hypothetical protein